MANPKLNRDPAAAIRAFHEQMQIVKAVQMKEDELRAARKAASARLRDRCPVRPAK